LWFSCTRTRADIIFIIVIVLSPFLHTQIHTLVFRCPVTVSFLTHLRDFHIKIVPHSFNPYQYAVKR